MPRYHRNTARASIPASGSPAWRKVCARRKAAKTAEAKLIQPISSAQRVFSSLVNEHSTSHSLSRCPRHTCYETLGTFGDADLRGIALIQLADDEACIVCAQTGMGRQPNPIVRFATYHLANEVPLLAILFARKGYRRATLSGYNTGCLDAR